MCFNKSDSKSCFLFISKAIFFDPATHWKPSYNPHLTIHQLCDRELVYNL